MGLAGSISSGPNAGPCISPTTRFSNSLRICQGEDLRKAFGGEGRVDAESFDVRLPMFSTIPEVAHSQAMARDFPVSLVDLLTRLCLARRAARDSAVVSVVGFLLVYQLEWSI